MRHLGQMRRCIGFWIPRFLIFEIENTIIFQGFYFQQEYLFLLFALFPFRRLGETPLCEFLDTPVPDFRNRRNRYFPVGFFPTGTFIFVFPPLFVFDSLFERNAPVYKPFGHPCIKFSK